MPRSLLRFPITRLSEFVEIYLDRFRPEWNNLGDVIVVRGPHGSGKTHTIYSVLSVLEDPGRKDTTLPDLQAAVTKGPVYPLYTVHQDDIFFELYKQVIAKLDFTLLKKISRSLLGAMAAEQLGADLGDDQVKTSLAEPLQREPERAERLFANYTIEESAAASRQARAILDFTETDFNVNLQNAVAALQGQKFDKAAADWLLLKPVSSDDFNAMRISGPITSTDDALQALQLLAALFTVAGYRFVLFVDQFEKLFVGTDPLLSARNAGYLRSLIEAFVTRNALLVLSGSDEGWSRLPEDTKQRIGQKIVDCPLLRLGEAVDLVRLYLTPTDKPFVPGIGSIHPFTEPAIRTMITLGAGNPRKLLQFCHDAFRVAAGSVIDEHLVSKLARADPPYYFDRARAIQETRRILSRQLLPVREPFAVQDMTFDFAFVDPEQKPLLLVDVRNAIFQDDEAANAHVVAGRVARLRKLGIHAPLVLVATGYVSPEIVGNLRDVVSELIVYAPETYEAQFTSVVDAAARNAAALLARAPSNSQLAEKVDLLLRLSEERATQAAVYQKRDEELAKTQARTRFEERLEKARNDWNEHRRKLEAEIQTTRKSRRDSALAAVNAAIRSSRRNLILRDAGFILVLALCYLLGAQSARSNSDFELFVWVGLALIFLILLVLDLAPVLTRPRLWKSLASARDLDLIHSETFASFFHRGNPLVRLGEYLRRKCIRLFLEPLALIRETALRQAERRGMFSQVPYDLWNVPEVVMLFQGRNAPTLPTSPDEVPQDIRYRIDLVSSLSGGYTRGTLALELAASVHEKDTALARVFDKGLDRADFKELPNFSERQLREAVRDLSPFEERGLGTCDFLDRISTIDEMFLFCSQLLFYTERDVLRDRSASKRLE